LEQGYHVEMEALTDHERVKDNVYEDGAPRIFGQRVLPAVRVAEAALDVRFDGY